MKKRTPCPRFFTHRPNLQHDLFSPRSFSWLCLCLFSGLFLLLFLPSPQIEALEDRALHSAQSEISRPCTFSSLLTMQANVKPMLKLPEVQSEKHYSFPVRQFLPDNAPQDGHCFSYRLSRLEAKNPLPAGSEGDDYHFCLKGTSPTALSLSFKHVGYYHYRLEFLQEGSGRGVTASPSHYTLEFLVTQKDDGSLAVPQMLVHYPNGQKGTSIDYYLSKLEAENGQATSSKRTLREILFPAAANTDKAGADKRGTTMPATGERYPSLLFPLAAILLLIFLLYLRKRKKKNQTGPK